MEFADVLKARHMVRDYLPKPVDDEVLVSLTEADATLAAIRS